LDIWQNGRRKIADENRDDCLTQAKRKPPVFGGFFVLFSHI